MMTSAPSTASSMRVTMRAPVLSISAGRSVAGPASVTPAPIFVRSETFDRATRLCETSPQMATLRPASVPFARRIVKASSSACVGCACVPSPAFTTAHGRLRARRCGAPERGWRITIASGAIAMRLRPVSRRVSPFATEVPVAERAIESADSRRSAISNEKRVRVEFSKNRFATSLPRSVGTFLIARWLISRIDSAVSRTRRMSSSVIPSMSRRSFFESARRGAAESGESGRFVTPPVLPTSSAIGGAAPGPSRARALARPSAPPWRPLGRGRGDLLADVLGLDRQLAAATVDEHGEEDLPWAAEIEDRVHRGADRAPREEHVVAENHVAALDRERDLRLLEDRRGRDCREVVAVERDVEEPNGHLDALRPRDLGREALRERDATRADPDEGEAVGAALGLDDFTGHARDRASHAGRVEQPDFPESSRSLSHGRADTTRVADKESMAGTFVEGPRRRGKREFPLAPRQEARLRDAGPGDLLFKRASLVEVDIGDICALEEKRRRKKSNLLGK